MKWVLIVMAVGASGQPEWRYRTLRHRGEAVLRTLMFALTLAFSPAYALDPLDMPKQWPDGPMKEFFQHLMRPDNDSRPQLDKRNPLSCCGAGDVGDTKYKVEHGNGPHPDDTWYARRAVPPRDRLRCAAEGRLVTKLPPRVAFPMPRLRVAALQAPTDFRHGCGSGDVSWRGLLRSATTAIERQRRIAAGKVARRLPPVTDRKKFSDDFLA